MATTNGTLDYSRRTADRPLGSRYVDYLEQFVRLKGPGPARAAADAAGFGGGGGGGGGASGASSGGRGIATSTVPRPPSGWEAPRRAVARHYPGRSWLPADQWGWQNQQQQQQPQPQETGGAALSFSGGQRRRAAAAAGGGGRRRAAASGASAASASALHGAGARLLPPPLPLMLLASSLRGPPGTAAAANATARRPNSALLPPGGMLLFDGGFLTPRRAKHRPAATPDLESGAAALSLLRHEPPAPSDPRGSWSHWPATLRALPLPPAPGGLPVTHDPITRHRTSVDAAWTPAAAAAPFLQRGERAPSPCTTARPSEAQAREAYASALEGYYGNKRRATFGGAARRYGRGPADGQGTQAQQEQTTREREQGQQPGAASWSAAPLLPARVRGQTGAARPASPVGLRWVWGEGTGELAGAAAAAERGTSVSGGGLAWADYGRPSSAQ